MRSPVALFLSCIIASSVSADPWRMYRGDAGRGSYTAETMPDSVTLQWTYKPAHAPLPAWPGEPRMPFDLAFQPVADAERVYFGSSADNKVYALDAATGQQKWAFFTGAPVRFAPALWKDRLFVVSDDGHLYCLRAVDGELLWKHRPGPGGRMILGNGRLISKWPARGGPAILDDIVYFGAGIWPSDKVYICALRAEDGEPVWINDTCGTEIMPQPHAKQLIDSGVSCQGYLAAAGDKLFVPTGRGVPAAFDRATGKFLYNLLFDFRTYGGSEVVAAEGMFFNSDLIFNAADGKQLPFTYRTGMALREGALKSPLLAVSPEYFYSDVYRMSRTKLLAPWSDEAKRADGTAVKVERVGLNVLSRFAPPGGGEKKALIVAGATAIVGGQGFVTAIAVDDKKTLWTQKIAGTALGLAASTGRLFVSTETGCISCFARGDKAGATIEPKVATDAAGDASAVAAAKKIVEKTGITEGYCLDLGCGDGQLALELARQTKLNIYGVESDPAKVAEARKRLDAAGLYGVRVTIHQGDPAQMEYPNSFADLVVCANSLTGQVVPQQQANRCACPYGGVICTGKPGAMAISTRGPLKGVGRWTHQYADAANTACSDDTVVKAPLTMLWFNSSDQPMPGRHGRQPAPLFSDGRLFIQGMHDLRAINAYNGRTIWQLPIRNVGDPFNTMAKYGTSVSGANLCTDGKTIYVRQDDRCIRVNATTGKIAGEFSPPADEDAPRPIWGYVACHDGLLFGSVANEGHVVPGDYRRSLPRLYNESKSLFAMDAATGAVKWQYQAKDSIHHNAIAVGDKTLYLIDREMSKSDMLPYTTRATHPTGVLLALDAATGKEKWRKAEDIFGTTLILSVKNDVLLMCYGPGATHQTLKSELSDQLAGFRASTGERLWTTKFKYTTRPVVIGQMIYVDPAAFDLRTGKRKEDFVFKRDGYGCGTLAGAANMLTYRASCLGYRDLSEDRGTRHFGGVRSSCWLSQVPAGGLVFSPDFTTGCECAYQMRACLALESAE